VSDRRTRSIAIVVALAVVTGSWVGRGPARARARQSNARRLPESGVGIRVSATWRAPRSRPLTRSPTSASKKASVSFVCASWTGSRSDPHRVDAHRLFAEPPIFCVVGPFSAPDSRLSDRCWGDPDLSVVVRRPPHDEVAIPAPPDAPVTVSATSGRRRGAATTAGEWLLEINVDPLVDGRDGRPDLPDAGFESPSRRPRHDAPRRPALRPRQLVLPRAGEPPW